MKLSLALFAACTMLSFWAVRTWRVSFQQPQMTVQPRLDQPDVTPSNASQPNASQPGTVRARVLAVPPTSEPTLGVLPAPPEDPRGERLLDDVLPYFPTSSMGVALATAAVNESLAFDGDISELERDPHQALSGISFTLQQLPKQHSGIRRELISFVSDLRVSEPERLDLLRREAFRTGPLVTPADTAIAFDALVELLERSPTRVQPIYDELKRQHAADPQTLAALEQAVPRPH